jgi:hypothetical protein
MEAFVYFVAGVCFHLYIYSRQTEGFYVTTQLPHMMAQKIVVSSFKKK